MSLGDIYMELNKKACRDFDEVVKKQSWFWCPICDQWLEEKRLEIVSTHTYFTQPENRMAVIAFGLCEPCKNHAGKNVRETVLGEISLRAARRATSGQSEKYDPRTKTVLVTEEKVGRK